MCAAALAASCACSAAALPLHFGRILHGWMAKCCMLPLLLLLLGYRLLAAALASGSIHLPPLTDHRVPAATDDATGGLLAGVIIEAIAIVVLGVVVLILITLTAGIAVRGNFWLYPILFNTVGATILGQVFKGRPAKGLMEGLNLFLAAFGGIAGEWGWRARRLAESELPNLRDEQPAVQPLQASALLPAFIGCWQPCAQLSVLAMPAS